MNIATILAIGIVVSILGFILLRRSKKDETIGNMKSTGMILIAIGAFVIIWFVVEFIMFLLNP